MVCRERTKLLLFAAYLVSIVSALANPADLNFEFAYQMAQGANIITLMLLSYCKQTWGDAFWAALLGVGFTLRTTGSWRGGSRWDSLLVTIGMLVVLQQAFYQVVPAAVPHRRLFYLVSSLIVLPVLSALPHLLNTPNIEHEVLQTACNLSYQAYFIPKTVPTTAAPVVADTSAPPTAVPGIPRGFYETTPPETAAPKTDAPKVQILQTSGPRPGWTMYEPSTDASAGVTHSLDPQGKPVVYVYFTGSESAKDWKNNLNILGDVVPSDWGCGYDKPMRTHQGYTIAFKSIEDEMMTALKAELSTVDGTPRIVFTGHSMGGAMATMAGLFIACKMPHLRPRISVVTFGSPQVGDGNFVAFFNKVIPTCARVVNPMDPVPRLLNAQLVHVKGYFPVGALSLKSTVNGHMPDVYIQALATPRAQSIIAWIIPALLVAGLVAMYIARKLGKF